jgi:hypothetical protein
MRYRWEIKTSDTWYSGTDASVFLSLSGLDASMREVQISDPDAINDWEKGDVNHGTIATEDLGDIQTGTLRHDGSGPAAGWSVDWVKVTNEEDGREWTATVGGFDTGGRFPLLRFTRTNEGQTDQVKRQKAQREADAKAKADADKLAAKRREAEQDAAREDARLEDETLRKQRDQERARRRARAEKQLAEEGTEANVGGAGQQAIQFRTFELFGWLGGARVPLRQVLQLDGNGRYSVVPNARVMVSQSSSEGFGLGGVPGQWSSYYTAAPSLYGLDNDKAVLASDGVRGWVLDSNFLTQIFGVGWRAAVYEL